MKRIFFVLAALALPSLAVAQTSNVRVVGRDTTGVDRPVLVTTDGKLQVSSTAGGTGASSNSVQGADANGATTTANPVLVAGSDGTAARTLQTNANGALTVSANFQPNADGLAPNSTSISSYTLRGINYLFNGTTFDRQRDATSASGTAGTGVLGAGVLGFDGTNYQRVSTTSSGYVNVAFGGSAVGSTSIGGDASTAFSSLRTAAFGQVFNGATWDRQRGDTTGTWVKEQSRTQYWVETTTPLAANAPFFGPGRDAGIGISAWTSFSCFYTADQAGGTNAAYIQSSSDGTNWTVMVRGTIVANTPLLLQTPVFDRFNRCTLNANAGTAQGSFIVKSRYGIN